MYIYFLDLSDWNYRIWAAQVGTLSSTESITSTTVW